MHLDIKNYLCGIHKIPFKEINNIKKMDRRFVKVFKVYKGLHKSN